MMSGYGEAHTSKSRKIIEGIHRLENDRWFASASGSGMRKIWPQNARTTARSGWPRDRRILERRKGQRGSDGAVDDAPQQRIRRSISSHQMVKEDSDFRTQIIPRQILSESPSCWTKLGNTQTFRLPYSRSSYSPPSARRVIHCLFPLTTDHHGQEEC